MMWEWLFLVILFIGFQFVITQWYFDNDSIVIKMNVYVDIFFFVLMISRYFVLYPLFMLILLSHCFFIGLGFLYRLKFDTLLVPTLILITFESLIIALNKLPLEYCQYVFYMLICFISFLYFLKDTFFFKMDKEWKTHISNIYLFLIILCLIISVICVYIVVLIMTYQTLIQVFVISLEIVFVVLIQMKVTQMVFQLQYEIVMNENLNLWQKESRDYMNVIRSQRHDFNFHLHAVVGLIENGEYEKCRQYVKNMANEASMINDIMPVYDSVIGSMLYNLKESAKKKNIDIEYNITYDMEHVLCNAFEINKILGNLIQNAIDAISNNREREYGIKVSIFKRRGNTVIIVSNCFQGDKNTILHAYDLGYSTKLKHEGIGLSMVKNTVERYGGRIYTEFEGDIVSFIVNIPNLVHFD